EHLVATARNDRTHRIEADLVHLCLALCRNHPGGVDCVDRDGETGEPYGRMWVCVVELGADRGLGRRGLCQVEVRRHPADDPDQGWLQRRGHVTHAVAYDEDRVDDLATEGDIHGERERGVLTRRGRRDGDSAVADVHPVHPPVVPGPGLRHLAPRPDHHRFTHRPFQYQGIAHRRRPQRRSYSHATQLDDFQDGVVGYCHFASSPASTRSL